MAPSITSDVLTSPAVGILCDLERDGFRVTLAPDNVLVIAPRSRLTPERMQAIAAVKDALRLLVSIATDRGVADRRDIFRQQLDAMPAPGVPAFLFRPDLPYVRGRCFSCGDALPTLTFSRCWRCSMAWRLTCRLPVPASVADAFDHAKVTA